jgi:hypothetical protein
MGPLAALIFHRIYQMKLFPNRDFSSAGPFDFLKPVLEYYDTHSKK